MSGMAEKRNVMVLYPGKILLRRHKKQSVGHIYSKGSIICLFFFTVEIFSNFYSEEKEVQILTEICLHDRI